MNRLRGVTDLLGFVPRDLRAQLGIIANLHQDGRCYFGHNIASSLLFSTEKWIKESGVAHLKAQFAVLEKNVYRLPERVIEDLDHLLVHERVLGSSIHGIGTFNTRQSKGHRIF